MLIFRCAEVNQYMKYFKEKKGADLSKLVKSPMAGAIVAVKVRSPEHGNVIFGI